MSDTDIAIVGMSCRFPGADSIEQFWYNLIHGVESLNKFEDYHPQSDVVIEKSSLPFIKINNLVKNFDSFDADFFSISEREAKLMDPQHRLFMECAWSALEDAGYFPDNLPGLTGLYAGVYANYYLLHNVIPNRESNDPASELAITVGNEKDHLSTYTAYKLNLRGPVLTVQSTCSSSLACVHLACESLLTYSSDMMLAGGVTISVPQLGGYFYQGGGLLSQDGHIRSFDSKANGTVYSNGVAVVALKRLEDAQRDKDTIYAVIKGSAINNDGSAKIGYAAPNADSQIEVITRALKNANIEPGSINYIEGHGTGTPLGDSIEIEALNKVFKGIKTKSCALGSVKSNIGHLGPVSGLSGLIKVALSLYHQKIPSTLNCPNPHEQLNEPTSPFYINSKLRDWICQNKKRAGISSFGLGGTNVHAILEEAPLPIILDTKKEQNYLFCVSAKNPESLREMIAQMKNHIEAFPYLSPCNLAYTLHLRRKPFLVRYSTVFSTLKDLSEQLAKTLSFSSFYSCDEIPLSPLFLFLDLGSTQKIESFIEKAWAIPDIESHFNCFISQLKTNGFSATVNRESQLMLIQKGSESFHSSLLFYFALYYSLSMQWMNMGLPFKGLVGSGIGLIVAIFLSKHLSLADIIPWVLFLENPVEENKGKQVQWINELLNSHKTSVPLYYLENQKITPLNDELPSTLFSDIKFSKMGPTFIPESDNICLLTIDGCLPSINCVHRTEALGRNKKIDDDFYHHALAQLWKQGFSIHWKTYYDKIPAYKIPLPTYAFQRKKYWLEDKNNSKQQVILKTKSEKKEIPIEQEMLSLWQKHLGIDEIGLEDNFFEKGGTSLVATSLVTAIQQYFDVEVELKDLFGSPTVKMITSCVIDKLLLNIDEKELESLLEKMHE